MRSSALINRAPATEDGEPSFMTWVKICGITNLEDARTAVEAGADALGFVFYEKSPRNVPPDTVREIVRQMPASGFPFHASVEDLVWSVKASRFQAGRGPWN